jgi:hypothetical protein
MYIFLIFWIRRKELRRKYLTLIKQGRSEIRTAVIMNFTVC